MGLWPVVSPVNKPLLSFGYTRSKEPVIAAGGSCGLRLPLYEYHLFGNQVTDLPANTLTVHSALLEPQLQAGDVCFLGKLQMAMHCIHHHVCATIKPWGSVKGVFW